MECTLKENPKKCSKCYSDKHLYTDPTTATDISCITCPQDRKWLDSTSSPSVCKDCDPSCKKYILQILY